MTKTDQDFNVITIQMLQRQFDSEYDNALGKEENQVNGSSKVRVSYSKYRMLPEEFDWDSEDEELEDLGDEMMKRDWDRSGWPSHPP